MDTRLAMILLAKWASFGSKLRQSQSTERIRWDGARTMVNALRKRAEPEAARLGDYLQRSNRLLEPLGEPFLVDFGVHRWLKQEREEAYSDWLAWIIAQLSDTPEHVFHLFDMRKDVPVGRPIQITVDRETPVRLEPEENAKRLDLLLRVKYKDTATDRKLYIIEVKVTDPESADTEKQKHYWEWLQQQPGIERREAVLVALEGKEKTYEYFRLLTWPNLCLELRKVVKAVLLKQNLTVPALVLAFVGAVEQNLCGLSANSARRVAKAEVPAMMTTDIADHLEPFVGEGSNEPRDQPGFFSRGTEQLYRCSTGNPSVRKGRAEEVRNRA